MLPAQGPSGAACQCAGACALAAPGAGASSASSSSADGCRSSFCRRCSRKAPDSGMARRPTTATKPGTSARIYGTLHAHACTAASPKMAVTAYTEAFANKKPKFAVMEISEMLRPKDPGDPTSVMYVEIVLISPAAHKPCKKRKTTKRARPNVPAMLPLAKDGTHPCPTVPMSMPAKEMLTAALRPSRSPAKPRTTPPRGRATKDTA
mmetsp:Transcript_65591/g.200899  ORF Transcript_65591/g.200899 Transcript_65591/m.200899 type:complete len:207 (+) Transcript_65591:1280-1900(+)